MKLSRANRLPTRLLRSATLLAAVISTLLVPAFSQQEVDPTWYNPWPEPDKVISQPSRPPVAHRKSERKTSSVSSDHRPPKSRTKRLVASR